MDPFSQFSDKTRGPPTRIASPSPLRPRSTAWLTDEPSATRLRRRRHSANAAH